MRKLTAALAAAGLLLISACNHGTASATPSWEQPATFRPVPSGLIATAQAGDRTELRVYSATDGRWLREFALPPVVGQLAFSTDLGYAADQDGITQQIHFWARSGNAFRPVEDWNLAMLDLQTPGRQPKLEEGGFIPGTDRYTVRVMVNGDPEIPRYKTISFEPAQPMTTMRDEGDRLPPDLWRADKFANLGSEFFEIPGLHARALTTTNGSTVTGADIVREPAAGPQVTLFTCGGGPFGRDELACVGAGKQAEVGVLTADVHQELARFRRLGQLPGKRFTHVFTDPGGKQADPGGKQLLAQRADGFYSLPATGGTPTKVFGPLAGGGDISVLSWSGSR